MNRTLETIENTAFVAVLGAVLAVLGQMNLLLNSTTTPQIVTGL